MVSIRKISKQEGRKLPWRVRYIEDGKDKSKYFAAEWEAVDWAQEFQPFTPVVDVTHEEKLLIQLARLRCKQAGVDMDATIKEFLQVAIVPRSVTLQYARDAYCRDMERRNVRESYRKNATYILDQFMMSREDWPVVSFTADLVVKYCLTAHGGETSRETSRSRLVTFFNWAREQGWTTIDTKQIKWRLPKTDRDHIKFWTPEMVWKFIEVSPDKIKFPVALLFLTGIRPKGEFMGLRHEDLDPKRKIINIPAAISKTRTPRTLYGLGDLWKLYKGGHGKVCPMTYRNFRTNITKVCNQLGYEWSHDVSRHTFGTCAYHKGMEWAMENMGHQNSRTFIRHYKGQIDPSEASMLWKL